MIYTNLLGAMVATHTLSPKYTGNAWSRTVCGWKLNTTATNLLGAMVWDTLEAATSDLRAMGFVVSDAPVNAYGDYALIHAETAAAIDSAACKWENATPCYVRYGRPPKGGKSKNYANGTREAGVSVYRGEMLPSGEARALPTTNQEAVGIAMMAARPLYVVTGVEVGVGSDGEPLLANCKIVRQVV